MPVAMATAVAVRMGHVRRPGAASIRESGKPIACYRDLDGDLHRCSAVCTHLGCLVSWNAVEKTWDCPCHGSRFDIDGHLLNGPVVSPLRNADPSTKRAA